MLSKFKALSKLQKILLIALSIIIIFAATCGIGYAVAPREFLQLILSDAAYTKLMLAKNLSTYYPEAEKLLETIDEKELGFDASGKLTATFADDAFGSRETTKSIEEYVNTLTVDSSLNINGALAKATCTLSDKDGEVLNADCIADPSNIYLDIPELDLGYMSMIKNSEAEQKDIGTINETYDNIISKKGEDQIRKAVYETADTAVGTFDKTLISIISDKTLDVGSVSATGDVATVVMPIEDFKNCITTTFDKVSNDKETFDLINSCLPDSAQMTYPKFKTKLKELEDKILIKVKESEITNVTLEFYINSRNEIVGMDIELVSPKTNIGICLVLKDDHDRGFAFELKERTDRTLLIDILKTDETSGTIKYFRETEDGPLEVRATYTNLEISEKAIYGHFQTDAFKIPGNKDLGEIKLDIVIKGENENLTAEIDISVKDLVDATVYLNASTADFTSFNLPKAGEVTPYDQSLVESAAASYLLSEMPRTHPAFAKVYRNVLSATIGEAVGQGISGLLGGSEGGKDLANAISGIIDGAINDDPSGIGDIINDFFSAFGLIEKED